VEATELVEAWELVEAAELVDASELAATAVDDLVVEARDVDAE